MPQRQIQLQLPPGLWPPTWPMGLTMLRLLLLPLFLWILLLDAGEPPHRLRWFAVAIFTVMAITDKLDGYLARKLNQTSKLGTLLDPVADKLLVACSVILLSFQWIASPQWKIPLPVVLAIYGKDVLVVIGTMALLTVVGHVGVAPRPLGKLSTATQLTLIIATLIAPDLWKLWPTFTGWLLPVLWWTVALLAIGACVDYLLLGWRQFLAAKTAASPPGATGESH